MRVERGNMKGQDPCLDILKFRGRENFIARAQL